MTFGERVKAVRKSASLTQEAFAARIGIKQNSVALIETDKRNASEQVILSVCREFLISETWLRTGEGEMKAPISREQEMAALVRNLMEDSPESFRSALVTTLLRFDPDGPEWTILEKIYEAVAKMQQHPDK